MKQTVFILAAALTIVTGCSTVPITGRQQLSLVSSETILPLSLDNYSEFLSTHKVVTGTPEAGMVKRVGSDIQRAVEGYFAGQGMSAQLEGYKWEFNLVEENEANAWCMPGGKVAVYTGILPLTKDDTGLAVVMGHEVAHAVARHGEERMSQALVAQYGGAALTYMVKEKPEETKSLYMTAFGVGSQVGVLLPYSRLQESEADRLGLIFMAMAGYDPRQAVDFWKRMSASKEGGAPLEILSTHPADDTRIKNIEKLIPEAMGYYGK